MEGREREEEKRVEGRMGAPVVRQGWGRLEERVGEEEGRPGVDVRPKGRKGEGWGEEE